MALYRNERVPPFEFVAKLKRVDPRLYVCYESLSMRWDVLFKSPQDEHVYHVHRVCQRDAQGRDIGFQDVDERTITKLLKMDLQRRGMSPLQYRNAVRRAEDQWQDDTEQRLRDITETIVQDERKTLARAMEAYRSV